MHQPTPTPDELHRELHALTRSMGETLDRMSQSLAAIDAFAIENGVPAETLASAPPSEHMRMAALAFAANHPDQSEAILRDLSELEQSTRYARQTPQEGPTDVHPC